MSYISSSLTFHSDKITINDLGDEVMMSWEDSLMSASSLCNRKWWRHIGNRIRYGNINDIFNLIVLTLTPLLKIILK